MLLAEQWVLVTGGARGLGQAITRALVREGAGVVINYHRSDRAAAALAEELGPRAIALQADVTDTAAVQKLFSQAQERTGQAISSVVNNALVGFAFDGDARPKIGDITWERFNQQMEGAVKGALIRITRNSEKLVPPATTQVHDEKRPRHCHRPKVGCPSARSLRSR